MDEKEERAGVEDYLNVIAQYEREFDKWQKRADKIVQRFRDEKRNRQDNTQARFNILWSNVQTLVPACFSRLPQPDVSRRFKDNDPVGRVAGLLLERALDYEVQHYPDYRGTMREVVQDRFLGGRGTAWVRYEPHFRAMQQQLPTDGVQVSDDIDEPGEELDYECAPLDYVYWKDFGHSKARTWEEVQQVWRVVYMYKEQVEDRFGEDWAEKLSYDASPDKTDRYKEEDNTPQQAKIYEIWDKNDKTVVWLSKASKQIIDRRDDPLSLEGFFPCPMPLFATITNESLVPVPDFTLYQDQAQELDILADRKKGLIEALKVRGVYDASEPTLSRLFTEGNNNDLLPVKNWQAFAEKNGLQGAMSLVDLKPIAEALNACYEAIRATKEEIYEITGISDIVRGQTMASETATSQQIKQNFVGLRLGDMQKAVAQFATDALRLKAQVMCAKFAPQTLAKIGGADQLSQVDQQMVGPALQLLLGDRVMNPDSQSPNPVRSFRIEVAADSLVQIDENQERKDRTEFLAAVGGYMQQALPVAQASPQAAPLIVELLKFGVTGFKVGKQIEGVIDDALDKLRESATNPQPRPDPEMAKVQAQQQADQMRLAHDQQVQQMQMQQEAQRMQMEAAIRAQEQRTQAAIEQHRNEMESAREQQRMQMESMNARFEALLKARTAVEVAEISAGATLDAAQISAANQGTSG